MIEDNRILRDGICAMLENDGDFDVVAQAEDSTFLPTWSAVVGAAGGGDLWTFNRTGPRVREVAPTE